MEIGRPVRVQWMRSEETAWDTKAPAFACTLRGALDAQGNLTGFDYTARAADYNHVGYNEPDTVLIAQLMGSRPARPAAGSAATPGEMYAIPNRRMPMAVVSLPLVFDTQLRTGNLRDPNGPQSTFASESFIDELAAAAECRPGRLPVEAAVRQHFGRFWIQARPIDRGRESSGANLRVGHPSLAARESIGKHPDRARHGLRVSRPDGGGGDCGSGSQSHNRARVGQAARVRARLWSGDQSGRVAQND
jgi:CO/xanthine dehydrogenase Mo-binding subunit